MNAARHQQIKQLFVNARELPAGERDALLDRECAGDPELRREVDELLGLDVADDFLEQGRATQAWVSGERSQQIGRYKLLQPIGEGGFGTVFMAEQLEPIRRRVALKLIKPGMDSRLVVARFEAERQALALMDHPNIAKVYDAGSTEDGRPYFVMELVHGIPITEYSDANTLTARERLGLFTAVCAAVQHAHQKGVIHRDLKPSNVLVTLRDGTPVPKVIDFGIAKALNGPLTERTLFTEFRQMIGTPAYMSPEQAETSELGADTRSDIYSLGVLLYELLTGTTPLDIRGLAYAEIQRTIREVDPPRPSARLSSLGGALTSVAEHRRVDPSSLFRTVAGDLDWIVMKALEKDRERRYPNARSFLEDVECYLSDQPVTARPPSLAYRMRKFVRRHRVGVGVGLVLFVMLMLGLVGITYGVMVARQNQLLAREAALRAEMAREVSERLRYDNQINAAGEAIQRGHRGNAQRLLRQCPDSMRGPEWQWLSFRLRDHAQILDGHPGGSLCLDYAPDGRLLLSGGEDGLARLWTLASGTTQQVFAGHRAAITAVRFGPRGQRIVTGDRHGRLCLWQVSSGERLGDVVAHMGAVTAVRFTPDGEHIAVGGADGMVRMWDLTTKTLRPPLGHHKQPVNTLAFAKPDVLLSAAKGEAISWFWRQNRVGEQLNRWSLRRMLRQPDHLKGWVSVGNGIALWSENFQRIDEWPLPTNGTSIADLASSGRQVILAGRQEAIYILDLETGHWSVQGFGELGGIQALAAHPQGDGCAVASGNGTIRVWSAAQLTGPSEFASRSPAEDLAHLPLQGELLVLGGDGQLRILPATPGEQVLERSVHTGQGFAVVANPDENRIVTYGYDRTLKIWDAATLHDPNTPAEPIQAIPCDWGVRDLALSPDGTLLAGPSPRDAHRSEGTLTLWDLASGRPRRFLQGLDNWALRVAFAPDGDRVAAAGVDGSVVVWGLDRGLPRYHFCWEEAVEATALTFTPDASRLLVGSADGRIAVWDLETGKRLRVLQAYASAIGDLVCSRHGHRVLALARYDGRIRAWNFQSGDRVWEFDSGLSDLTRFSLSHDESLLMVADQTGTVRRWPLSKPPSETEHFEANP